MSIWKLLLADKTLSKQQIVFALMYYCYRNNATIKPLKPLKPDEVETLMSFPSNPEKVRLIFENALNAERSGKVKLARFQLKFLIDNEFVLHHEPAMKILADSEYTALDGMKESI